MAQTPTSRIAPINGGISTSIKIVFIRVPAPREEERITITAEGQAETDALHAFLVSETQSLAPVGGVFRDDPTWDNFMRNIEEYSNYVDALERERL